MIRFIGRTVASIISALPDLTLGATYLITWIRPDAFGDGVVKHLLVIALLEFIIIHSAAFMGVAAISQKSLWRKTLAILGFGLFYSLFAGAFSLAFDNPWPLVAFWALTLNRLLRVILAGLFSEDEKALMTAEWAAATVAYILFIFLTSLLPMPRLGMDPAVVPTLDLPGEGLWIDQPQRFLAFGFLYFTTLGILSLATIKWVPEGNRTVSRR